MQKGVVLLDGIKESGEEMRTILESRQYMVAVIQSFSRLEDLILSEDYLAVIIDIDSVPVDNRMIRNLAITYPGVRFLCTSKDRFHPDLRDAICYHIYACLNKPVDPDELLYWIKSIFEEENIPDT
jgi:DNA-binding NtrC family response regulator